MDVEVEWRAFELRPPGSNLPPLPEDYLKRAWEAIHRLNREFGMPLMRRNSRWDVSSRLALEGQKYAALHGRVWEYTTEVYRAQFYDDKDISDMHTLQEAAQAAGLDPDHFRSEVESGRFTRAVEEDVALAARWGVRAVPCFIVGNKGLMGVQREEALAALVQGGDEQ